MASRQLSPEEKQHYLGSQMALERRVHPDPHCQIAVKVEDWTDDDGNPLLSVLTKRKIVWDKSGRFRLTRPPSLRMEGVSTRGIRRRQPRHTAIVVGGYGLTRGRPECS